MKNITLEKVLTVLAVAIGGLFLMYISNPELMDLNKILEAITHYLSSKEAYEPKANKPKGKK